MNVLRLGLLLSLLLTPLVEANSISNADKVWVIVRPNQCLSNPWEKDWLSRHGNQTTKYPMKKEGLVIKDYFTRKQIPVLDVRQKRYVNGDPICQSCDCPRGDTIFVLIHAQDVPKMVKFGYTERLAANEVLPLPPPQK